MNHSFSWPFFFIGLVFFTQLSQAEPISKEIQIKAGLIKNFINFTRWPNDKNTTSSKYLYKLCVIGKDPYSAIFKKFPAFNILGRSVSVDSMSALSDQGLVNQCDILFIRISDKLSINKLISMVDNLPILTISEFGSKERLPVMINFSYDKQSIGFSINQNTAKLAGLSFSSRMLRLANNIEGSNNETF